MKKYILDGKNVKEASLIEWAAWYEKAKRHVSLNKLKDGTKISTVFLGLDHSFDGGPPLLFETMIFGGKHDGYCERYTTWEEAEEGHKEALKLCKP